MLNFATPAEPSNIYLALMAHRNANLDPRASNPTTPPLLIHRSEQQRKLVQICTCRLFCQHRDRECEELVTNRQSTAPQKLDKTLAADDVRIPDLEQRAKDWITASGNPFFALSSSSPLSAPPHHT